MENALVSLGIGLLGALADELISDDEWRRWTQLSLNIVKSGVNTHERLVALRGRLKARLDAGEHFQPEDFDAIVAEIESRDAAWADL